MAAAASLVHYLRILFGDEAHAVKAGDVQIFQCICPVEGSRLSAFQQGNDRGSLHSLGWIVYDDDPVIFVNADVPLMSGDFCRVRVTGALEYDLIGELADEFTE